MKAWQLAQRLPDNERVGFWRSMQDAIANHPEAAGRYQLREWLACQIHGNTVGTDLG